MREFIENIKAGSVKASEELQELLAKKVKEVVKEEQKKVAKCILIEEDITEELDPGDDAKVWIDDFIKSDAPQFKGKTKEQRINMALAAYYSARKEAGLEESELDEATFKNKEVEKRFLAMKKMSSSQLKKVHSDTVGGSTSGMSDEDFINDILLSEFGIKKLSEQIDLSESVMDQKMWDKIKKGDKLTISYDDSFKGGNKVTLVVVSKNIVGKQKVGKMTMKRADGSSKFKFYIYNRDGRMGLAIGNLAASMTDVVMESKDVEDLKEWGSSDWGGVIRAMDSYLKKRGVNPDTITQAAEDQAEFHYDNMGYDSAEDAVPSIINMWKIRSKTGQKLMAMFSKK